jgi:hypothetical protein
MRLQKEVEFLCGMLPVLSTNIETRSDGLSRSDRRGSGRTGTAQGCARRFSRSTVRPPGHEETKAMPSSPVRVVVGAIIVALAVSAGMWADRLLRARADLAIGQKVQFTFATLGCPDEAVLQKTAQKTAVAGAANNGGCITVPSGSTGVVVAIDGLAGTGIARVQLDRVVVWINDADAPPDAPPEARVLNKVTHWWPAT